eukprot:2178217-Prymnesium_polylepis.2
MALGSVGEDVEMSSLSPYRVQPCSRPRRVRLERNHRSHLRSACALVGLGPACSGQCAVSRGVLAARTGQHFGAKPASYPYTPLTFA